MTANVVLVVIFAIAIGLFCNLVGNLTTQSITYGVSKVWISVVIQASIAAGILMIAIGVASKAKL